MASGLINSNLNLYIPLGFDDAPPEVAGYLNQILNSMRLLQNALNTFAGATMQDQSLWSYLAPDDTMIVGNMGRLYAMAEENISYGAIISPHVSGGVLKIRNANATDNTRPGIGYCSLSTGVTTGNYAEFTVGPSLCTAISGMTIGTRYFLNTTNGQIVNAEPVAAGNIGQALGIALATDKIFLNPSFQWVQH